MASRQEPPRSADISKGQELALELLAWFESDPDVTAARACLDPAFRRIRASGEYENVVLTKLREARLQGPEVEEGFTMILGDLIAVCAQGAAPDSDYYTELAERGVIERAVAKE